jgi:hypothetical protein
MSNAKFHTIMTALCVLMVASFDKPLPLWIGMLATIFNAVLAIYYVVREET